MRRWVSRSPSGDRGPRNGRKRSAQRTRDVLGDVGLDLNDVARGAVVILRPLLRPGFAIDQFRSDADSGGRLANAAVEDVANPELFGGGSRIVVAHGFG